MGSPSQERRARSAEVATVRRTVDERLAARAVSAASAGVAARI